MIVPDVNLLYAYDSTARHHAASRAWLTANLAAAEPIGLAMSTIVAFVRLATDSRVFRAPLAIEAAIGAIEALVRYENVSVIHPGDRHLALFKQIVLAARASRDLIPDAHLAALAFEHGGSIHTNDRDFDRFRGVRVVYPLAPDA